MAETGKCLSSEHQKSYAVNPHTPQLCCSLPEYHTNDCVQYVNTCHVTRDPHLGHVMTP